VCAFSATSTIRQAAISHPLPLTIPATTATSSSKNNMTNNNGGGPGKGTTTIKPTIVPKCKKAQKTTNSAEIKQNKSIYKSEPSRISDSLFAGKY